MGGTISFTFSPAADMGRFISAFNVRTRLEQHRAGRGSKFVKQYGVLRLVHVEEFPSPQAAIAREKQLKNWHRD